MNIDYAVFTSIGGREINEDYVTSVQSGDSGCFVICDGLGGHEKGEVASKLVGDTVVEMFENEGDSWDFIPKAFELAQERLLKCQRELDCINNMKSTMGVLVVSGDMIKWGHIGDSRIYHIYKGGDCYERTRDHSLAQYKADRGEIKEQDIRSSEDRSKLLVAMGSEWGRKNYEESPVLECEAGDECYFAMMTDGFWEYIYEEEMIDALLSTEDARGWLDKMTRLVESRIEEEGADNYTAICVRISY